MKKLYLLILTVILIVYSTTSFAFVTGTSNFILHQYPELDCYLYKPTKPYKPYSFNSQWEIDNYNSEVNRYNMELEAYIDCVNTYIEGCNNDIKRIKEAAQEALNDTIY